MQIKMVMALSLLGINSTMPGTGHQT